MHWHGYRQLERRHFILNCYVHTPNRILYPTNYYSMRNLNWLSHSINFEEIQKAVCRHLTCQNEKWFYCLIPTMYNIAGQNLFCLEICRFHMHFLLFQNSCCNYLSLFFRAHQKKYSSLGGRTRNPATVMCSS